MPVCSDPTPLPAAATWLLQKARRSLPLLQEFPECLSLRSQISFDSYFSLSESRVDRRLTRHCPIRRTDTSSTFRQHDPDTSGAAGSRVMKMHAASAKGGFPS